MIVNKIDLDNSIKFEIGSINQMKNIEYCLHIFFNQFNIKNIDCILNDAQKNHI